MNYIRTDTEKEPRTDRVVEEDRQQFIGCLAMRGEGKSYLLESYAEEAFLKGYTILDLHGADNLENAFWVFKSQDPDVKNPINIPITLLAQESLTFDDRKLFEFNSRAMTNKEWYALLPFEIHHKLYPLYDPPRVPFNKTMIDIVRLPRVTSSKTEYETEDNQKVLDKIIEIILNCRDNRRILVLNRTMFASERQYFWTMELIVRNLVAIADKNFVRLEPEDVGLPKGTPRKKMNHLQRNRHRMMIVTRELGELCPSRAMKGDKSGESLSVKKGFFNLIRKARHPQIDWIADWQRNNDVEDAVRSQADKWVFKRYNEDLAGDDKKNFFDQLRDIRQAIFLKHGPIAGEIICKSNFPLIEKLNPKYHYLWISGIIHLKMVRKVRHQHKEPWHRFWKMTGIEFDHDFTKVKEDLTAKSADSSKDLAYLYTVVRDIKSKHKGKKKLKRKDILEVLAKLQQEKKVTFHLSFETMSETRFSTYLGRWKTIHEELTPEIVLKSQ